METIKLNVQKRKADENLKELKKHGIVPGVLYGAGKENISVQVPIADLELVYKEAGERALVALSVDSTEPEHILICEVSFHPVSDEPIHVDFLRVKMDEVIEAEVDIEFIKESLAVKDKGGVLVKNISSVKVKALPLDLPKDIEVDISVLESFDDVIKVSDLNISEKVKILENPNEIVATVTPPRTEEELAALDETVEEDVEDVEVEEKGKKEEEDEEGEGVEGDEEKSIGSEKSDGEKKSETGKEAPIAKGEKKK